MYATDPADDEVPQPGRADTAHTLVNGNNLASTDAAEPIRAGRRQWIGLAVLALPTLLVSLDTFVMLLALPHLAADLGASGTEQLWIMDIYGFLVAGLLITAGALGDRVGRRRLLLAGAAAFGVASVLAAYATSPAMLIAARALLGIAGATLTPSTLSLITSLFHDARQRATAIGIWAGCFTLGAIIGPLVGGIMLDHFWWGSVLLLGVPAMVILLVLGPALLPEYRDPAAGRLDPTSVVLSLVALLSLVYGLKEFTRHGPGLIALVALVAGVVTAVVFVRRQIALAYPLLDLKLFANRGFGVTLGAMLAFTLLSGGTMVFVAQYLQLVGDLTPYQAGLAMAPGMAAAVVGFQIAPILARRHAPAVLLASGLAVATVGLLILARAEPSAGLAAPIGGFALVCLGGAPLVSLGTGLVIGSAPPEKAGSAAGLAQTGNECGYALGIAVLGSVGAVAYRAAIGDGVPPAARDSFTAAARVGDGLPEGAAAALTQVAREAFITSLHTVAVISATAVLIVAVVVLVWLRHLRPLTNH
jgi:MFS transporter, DHA2 family, multidrug resistance protein